MRSNFKILKIFFLLFILLTHCANDNYDFSNLKAFNLKLQLQIEQNAKVIPPYIAKFKTPKNEIYYIATTHQNNLNNPTFRLIDKTIKDFNPNLVILEGFPSAYGLSPTRINDYINKFCITNWKCGENSYGAYLAAQKNIPFLGGEPQDSEIFKALEEVGYKEKDIIFFYFTRHIPQYYRENKNLNEDDLPILFKDFIANINPSQTLSFDDYKNFLKQYHKKEANFPNLIDPSFTAPLENGSYVQKISTKISIIRDQHILKTILDAANNYSKILVIYGCSHYAIQKNVLESYFGKANYST